MYRLPVTTISLLRFIRVSPNHTTSSDEDPQTQRTLIHFCSAIQMNVTSTVSHILQWSSPIKCVPYDKNQTVYQLHASHFFYMFHRFNKLPIMKQSTVSNTHNNNDETRMDDALVPSNKEAFFSLFRTLI